MITFFLTKKKHSDFAKLIFTLEANLENDSNPNPLIIPRVFSHCVVPAGHLIVTLLIKWRVFLHPLPVSMPHWTLIRCTMSLLHITFLLIDIHSSQGFFHQLPLNFTYRHQSWSMMDRLLSSFFFSFFFFNLFSCLMHLGAPMVFGWSATFF